MSLHHAAVEWKLEDGSDFASGNYSRAHDLDFGHGLVVPGSPSPLVVAAPWSRQGAIDPEAAFVASLGACHMLWFLDLARQAGWTVVVFSGPEPTPDQRQALHHQAHQRCFIANSVTTRIVVEG